MFRSHVTTVYKSTKCKNGSGPYFRHFILEKFKELLRGVVSGTAPATGLIVVPYSTKCYGGPLSKHWFWIVQMFQTNGDQIGLIIKQDHN